MAFPSKLRRLIEIVVGLEKLPLASESSAFIWLPEPKLNPRLLKFTTMVDPEQNVPEIGSVTSVLEPVKFSNSGIALEVDFDIKANSLAETRVDNEMLIKSIAR